MSSFWSKRIKNKEGIANKVGVESEKIQELVDGEREIEGKTMDRVLQAVEEEKMLRPIKSLEILQWYKDTDLKELREKFGYKSQSELARKIGCDNSTICNFENKKVDIKEVSKRLIQYYNFFQDDFNRKPIKKIEVNNKDVTINNDEDLKIYNWYLNTDIKSLRGNKMLKSLVKKIKIPYSSLYEIETKNPLKMRLTDNIKKVYYYYEGKTNSNNFSNNDKEIWKWYKNNDLKALRESYGMNQYELSQVIKMSQPCVSDVELKRVKSVSITMRKMYEYYMSLGEPKPQEKDIIFEWYKGVEDFGEYRRKFGYSKNKFMAILNLSFDQIKDFEGHKYKSATPIVKKIYDFYHNEDNRLPEIEWVPIVSNNKVEDKEEEKVNVVVDETSEIINSNDDDCDYKKMYDDLLIEFQEKEKELRELYIKDYELKLQIKRYEKLIDKL